MALKTHYVVVGLTFRQHGNHNRLPHNAMSFEDTKYVLRFLQNYAELHAILLPGRIPSYKRDDLVLLPSSTTKKVSLSYTVRIIHNNNLIMCLVVLLPALLVKYQAIP